MAAGAGFALVWLANSYMGIFERLRLDIKREPVEIEELQPNKKRRAA